MAITDKFQDPLLTTEEFAEYALIHPVTAIKMRTAGTGPEYIRTGSGRGQGVRYRKSAVEKWLRSRTVKPSRWKSA